ncbi:MAG: DUF4175 family protein [Salinibacter sp.]
MSEQTARLVSRLRRRLRHTARRMTYAEMAFGLAVAVGSGTALWLLITLLEASFWFGTTARMALAAASATVALGIGAAVLGRPLAQWLGLVPGPSDEDIARAVGHHHPGVADRLVNLLHLAEGKRSHAPAPLVDRAVHDLANDVDELPFEEIEDFGRARRAVRIASIPLVGVLAFLLVAPSTFLNASERLLAPGTEFDRPAPFQLSVRPGDTQVATGDSLQIAVQATGDAPRKARLMLRDTTNTTQEVTLEADSLGRFRHTIPNVRSPLQYRVVAAPARTPWHQVRVAARPRVQELQLTVTPPSYTGQSPRTLDPNVGDVTALPGARVEVDARLSGPEITTAVLDFDGGGRDTLTTKDSVATGSFVVRRDDTYRLRLQGANDLANRSPIAYNTSLRTDADPSASFESPDHTTDLSPDLVQPLQVQIRDDYGIRRAELFYRMADQQSDEDDFSSIELPLADPDDRTQTLSYEWLLAQDSGLDPQPGDEIAYFVKVWDNDTVNGPKSGQTRTQRLRMPSLAQQYEALDETQRSAEEQIDSLQQQADASSQQFDQVRREIRQSRETNWQNERQVEQLKETQGAAQDAAESLSQSIEKMTQQMQKNGLSSQQTAEQFQEMKRVADELSSAAPQQALDELKEALSEDQPPRQRQQALDTAEQRQQEFQDQLERAQELFEQLQARQQLEELGNRTEDLAETQQALEEKTTERMEDENPSDSSDTAPSDSAQTETTSPSDRSEKASDSTASPDSMERPSQDSSNAPSPSASSDSSDEATSPSNEDLSQEQAQAADEMRDLMDEMEEAKREMNDVESAPQQQLQKMNQQLQQQQMPQQMEENSQQLRNNQLQQAQQGQQQMQQQLQNMQQQMRQMQKKMEAQQQRQNVSGLRSALENTLRLSKEQEALRSELEAQSAEDEMLRRYARDQNVLVTGLERVTDSLRSIARTSPSMTQAVQTETGQALDAMEAAVTALDEREGDEAAGQQRTSMTHLNELGLLLSDLLSQMQQQQGMGQGMSAQQMMQQLQQTSGQQQKLNNQVQQQLNKAQGERLSQGEQAQRRQKLAQQQRKLKQELSDLEADGEAEQQVMGDLGKIQDQMEESADALEQGRARDELREQQQQILTRLLNAQKSMRTQGKQQERRGEAAEGDAPSRNPDERTEEDERETLRRDLIRSLEMGYSSSYEDLIREYFDLLEEQAPDSSSAPE